MYDQMREHMLSLQKSLSERAEIIELGRVVEELGRRIVYRENVQEAIADISLDDLRRLSELVNHLPDTDE